MKLALGTVQFGLDYGVSNTAGRVPEPEVKAILEKASARGVSLIDTAPAYGESEAVLGRATADFQVVTKTGSLDPSKGKVRDQVRAGLETSLQHLKRESVYGLLVHRASDLMGPHGDDVADAMEELRSEARVERIGVSVYDEKELAAVIGKGDFDLVQAPASLIDQRLLTSGSLGKLKAAGVEIHVRSAFLQGLLLMAPADLDNRFESVRGHLRELRQALETRNLTVAEAALGFLSDRKEIDKVVIGVCSVQELEQAIDALSSAEAKVKGDWAFAGAFAWSDEKVLNPSLWGKPS